MLKIDFLAPVRCPRGQGRDWHRALWAGEIRHHVDTDSRGWASALMLVATHREAHGDFELTPMATRNQAEGLTGEARICLMSTLAAGTHYAHLPSTSVLRGLTRAAGVDVAAVVMGFRRDLGVRNPTPDEIAAQVGALTSADVDRAGWVAATLWSDVDGDAVELRRWAAYAAWLDAKPPPPR